MPASLIAGRLGWIPSETVFRSKVAQLRPLYPPPDPHQRTEDRPGELTKWDSWFPEASDGSQRTFGHARRSSFCSRRGSAVSATDRPRRQPHRSRGPVRSDTI